VRTPEGVADQILTVRPRMTLLELVMVNPAMSAVVGVVLLVLIGREKLVEIIKLWLAH
jgi:integral membrane sensor domain MASE1